MIYLLIGLIATAVLLVSVVFDGIFEAFDIDFLDTGFLSVSALSAGAAIFGFVAHFASTNGLPGGVMGGAVAGLVALIAVGYFTTWLKSSSELESRDAASIVGTEGTVVVEAPAGRYATVTLSFHGSTEQFGARCAVDLKRGDRVKVVAADSHSSLEVVKIIQHTLPSIASHRIDVEGLTGLSPVGYSGDTDIPVFEIVDDDDLSSPRQTQQERARREYEG